MRTGRSSSVRVAIAGVGNCASSLVQSVAVARSGLPLLGLTHEPLGPYRVADIEFVTAFDVDSRKIGQDLAEAVFEEPNCTTRYISVEPTGVLVRPGPVADGVSKAIEDLLKVDSQASRATFDQVAAELVEAAADVLICYLPTGSPEATAGYAGAALQAGVAFVNCNPEPIASDPRWRQQFTDRQVPLLGDDIKSQLGATTLHRTLIDLCRSRGATVDRTYQLNVGGNTDFLNMRDPERAASKRHSKMLALRTRVGDDAAISAGPSDYAAFLRDHKVAYFVLSGRSFLGMPFTIDVKLTVEDSPNSAGVAVDAVRAAKLAADRGIGGPVTDACAYLFKSPPEQQPDPEAARRISAFARGGDGER